MREKSDDASIHKPWWLDEETQCEHCFQHYSHNIGYYCIQCDRPVCPLCIVVVDPTQDVHCPQCQSATLEAEE